MGQLLDDFIHIDGLRPFEKLIPPAKVQMLPGHRRHLGGRPKAMDEKKAAMARSMHRDKNLTVKKTCETLGIGKTTFYLYVNAD